MTRFTDEQLIDAHRMFEDYTQRCEDQWGDMLEELTLKWNLDDEEASLLLDEGVQHGYQALRRRYPNGP